MSLDERYKLKIASNFEQTLVSCVIWFVEALKI